MVAFWKPSAEGVVRGVVSFATINFLAWAGAVSVLVALLDGAWGVFVRGPNFAMDVAALGVGIAGCVAIGAAIVLQRRAARAAAPAAGEVGSAVPAPVATGSLALSAEARQLMGAKNPNGVISIADWSSLPTVCIERLSRSFHSDNDPSLRTRYVEAVQELVDAGLVVQHERTNYSFTKAGWDLYRELNANPMPPDVSLWVHDSREGLKDSVVAVRNLGGAALVSARVKIIATPPYNPTGVECPDYRAWWIEHEDATLQENATIQIEAGLFERIRLAESGPFETDDPWFKGFRQVQLIGPPTPCQWIWHPHSDKGEPFVVTLEVELHIDPPMPVRRWARVRIMGKGSGLSTALVAQGD